MVRMQGAGHNFLVARRRETLVALSAFIDGVDRADAGDMYALNR
jgi:hypothetical protein